MELAVCAAMQRGHDMNKIIVLLFILLSSIASATESDKQGENYLCLGDSAAGIYYKNGEWDSARVDVRNQRFIINRVSPDRSKDRYMTGLALKRDKGAMKWAVREFDDPDDLITNYCLEFSDDGNLYCRWGGSGEVRFNRYSGLFQLYRSGGYVADDESWWEDEDIGHDSPMVVVGKCSRID